MLLKSKAYCFQPWSLAADVTGHLLSFQRPKLWSHCYELVRDRGNSQRGGNVKISRPVTSHPTDFILFQWCHPSPLTLSFSFTMSAHPLIPPCSAFNKVSSLETRNGLPIFIQRTTTVYCSGTVLVYKIKSVRRQLFRIVAMYELEYGWLWTLLIKLTFKNFCECAW